MPIIRDRQRGFTIVELLIVIVVIGVLAVITVVAYNGVRQRAQVASVADGLKKVDSSMRLWMITSGQANWPLEPTFSGGTALSQMISDNPGLRDVLQNVPSVIGVGTEEWFYDNDVGYAASSECGDMYNGVNIVIKYILDEAIAKGVDKTIDDGNIYCGKVKWDPTKGVLFYSLSYDPLSTDF